MKDEPTRRAFARDVDLAVAQNPNGAFTPFVAACGAIALRDPVRFAAASEALRARMREVAATL